MGYEKKKNFFSHMNLFICEILDTFYLFTLLKRLQMKQKHWTVELHAHPTPDNRSKVKNGLERLTQTIRNVNMWMNAHLHHFMYIFVSVSTSVLSRCGSRLGVTGILIALRLIGGGGASRSRITAVPSTSLIPAATSGLQRFPVKLSSLYVREQDPAERWSRDVSY